MIHKHESYFENSDCVACQGVLCKSSNHVMTATLENYQSCDKVIKLVHEYCNLYQHY